MVECVDVYLLRLTVRRKVARELSCESESPSQSLCVADMYVQCNTSQKNSSVDFFLIICTDVSCDSETIYSVKRQENIIPTNLQRCSN